MIERLLRRAAAEGVLAPAPIDVLAHLVLSALIEAALLIAHSDDRRAAREKADLGLMRLLSGLLVNPVAANDPGAA